MSVIRFALAPAVLLIVAACSGGDETGAEVSDETGADSGPDQQAVCDEACARLYTAKDGCRFARPGVTQVELYELCMRECGDAMEQEGDLGDYDPNQPLTGAVSVELLNRAQAEAWAACIASHDCADFEDGYCAPVW